MATTLTTPTTVYISERPHPTPLELNLNGNYPYYPNYRLFFKENPNHSLMKEESYLTNSFPEGMILRDGLVNQVLVLQFYVCLYYIVTL